MKILLALCLLLAPMPVAALSPTTFVSVRVEFVYSVAMQVCYRLQTVKNAQVEAAIYAVKTRFGLVDYEVLLLLNFCLLYDQGYNRKVPV